MKPAAGGGGGAETPPPNAYEAIYFAVRKIPRGRVCTYGRIAARAGLPGRARQVGYALHALPAHSRVPWHRVVNAQGRLSLERVVPGGGLRQRFLLEKEGVEFDAGGRISLAEYGWG
jgi:methylated-DNA-protein-cysteine methyltransferase-like protein